MTVSLKHGYTATGANNPNKQVSVDRWNQDHTLTGTANTWLGFDANGNATENEMPVAKAATRSALAAKSAAAGMAHFLAEAGREGLFLFDDDDLSDKVTADTAQGLYVPPSSDTTGANGAWVRRFEGPVNPVWFGLTEGDASGDNGADNDTAIEAMFAALRSRAANVITDYQGLEPVKFPPGYYEFDSTIEITDGSGLIEGSGFNVVAEAAATLFKFPAGVTGIRVQRYNTSALVTDGVTHRGGDRATIRNLALTGGYSGTEDEAHGIHLRAGAYIENVCIQEFEGDGVYSVATSGSGGATEGNANNTKLYNVRVQECRNGIYIDGADANIWTVIGCDLRSNRQWGVWDSSFLGNTYVGCHAASNGLVTGTTPTVVSYSGNRYSVVAGQESGASTNAPSGTATDNTWWLYIGSGAASAGNNIPDWSSGETYRAGGSYQTDNSNARNALIGCYTEGGQGRPQIVTPSLVVGGILAASNTRGSLYGDADGVSALAFRSFGDKGTSNIEVTLGAVNNNTTKGIILAITDSAILPNTSRFQLSGNDIIWDYANSGTARAFLIAGPLTAQEFGTGAAVPDGFYVYKLMVGSSVTNGRQITNGTAAPTSGAHGTGEVVFNRTPATNNVFAWVCTVAGTPGTWIAIPARGGVVTKSSTSHTAALTDGNCYLRFTNGSSVTFTVPPNSSVAFPIGVQIDGIQAGAGALTIAAGSGVTINSYDSDLTIAGQYGGFTLVKVATDEWDIHGKFA